jgi:DNA-binding PadR family transcriptional regulator
VDLLHGRHPGRIRVAGAHRCIVRRYTSEPIDALGAHQQRLGGNSELMPEPNLDLGRFAEPSLLILVSLSDGPKHGYAIMTDVEAGTGRPLGPGTLYAALARLEERGFIEALAPVDRRRPYRLTALGATNLKEQLAGLEAFARLGLRRLGADRT